MVLDLVDDGLVLEDAAVVLEVDGLRGLGESGDSATGVFVALLESLERGDGLAAETKVVLDGGPVDLEGCAALQGVSAWGTQCRGSIEQSGRREKRLAGRNASELTAAAIVIVWYLERVETEGVY